MNLAAILKMLGPQLGPKTPDYGDPLRDQRDSEREALLALLGQSSQMQPMPGATQPAFRTPDAITGGLGLLLALAGGKDGKELGAGVLSGLMQSKMSKADSDTKQRQQEVVFQNQQAQQQHGQSVDIAKARLGFAEDDLERDLKQKELLLRRQDMDAQIARTEIEKAMKGYNDANSEGEKEFWAARLQTLDPKNAPTPEMVEADKSQLRANRVNQAMTRWNTLSGRWVNDYGELNEAQVSQATQARNSIAKEFNIDPESLPLPLTGTTLKKQMQDEKIKEMTAKGIREDDKAAQQIAKWKADIAYREKKLALDANRIATQADINRFNANTRRIQAENAQAQKGINKAVDTKLNSLQAKINGLKAKQSATQSPTQRRAIQTQIDQVAAERDFWKQQKGEDMGVTTPPSVGTSTHTTRTGNKFSFDTSK